MKMTQAVVGKVVNLHVRVAVRTRTVVEDVMGVAKEVAGEMPGK